MFPLFRKGRESGGSPNTVVGRTASAPHPHVEPVPKVDVGLSGTTGIQVQESALRLSPEVEEAVMLYASGRIADATASLSQSILDQPDSQDPLPWQLLFDIYEATGRRQQFEDLAVEFAVRFEQSPPPWQPPRLTNGREVSVRAPGWAMPATLAAAEEQSLRRFLSDAAQAPVVELDFSKSQVPATDDQAQPLLDALRRVVALARPVRVSGGEAFLVRINASRADGRLGEPGWLLLLMVLQLTGKVEEFEAIALEYAVRFEMSPPSWVTLPEPPATPVVETAGSAAADDAVFRIEGVLDAKSAAVFEELRRYAWPRPVLEIDLGCLTRIDFNVVGLLIDSLHTLTEGGRRVVLREVSTMIDILLRMVGADQYATLQPRQRK